MYSTRQLMVPDGIPVSTTMCITGSTAGVGLVSGGREFYVEPCLSLLTLTSQSNQLEGVWLDLPRLGYHRSSGWTCRGLLDGHSPECASFLRRHTFKALG